ncbi:MAG: hypothetical protein RLZZ479_1304 [Bacteroidota bacterium]|jgi:UPF0755 protein
MKILKVISLIALVAVAIGGFLGYKFLIPNVPNDISSNLVQIPTGSSFDEVVNILLQKGFIKDESSFRWTANAMGYSKNVRAGQYSVTKGMRNLFLVNTLLRRNQTPVKLVIHNKRTIPQVAGFLSTLFEADSLSFLNAFSDETFLNQFGYNKATAMTAFIPNTYELYWTLSPKEIFTKMHEEKNKFWDKEQRREKLKQVGLSESEVYTLASIVETESQYKPERPNIAGVYLNRLREGMPLQADPTLVFAHNDFTIQRVRSHHKDIVSPYNTYKNKGLPPGPIYMSSISSIDAVLNYNDHDYLYFCAKPDNSGAHNFAKTFEQHVVNANNYRSWLDKQGVE